MGLLLRVFLLFSLVLRSAAFAIPLPELTVRDEEGEFVSELRFEQIQSGEISRLRAHPSLDAMIPISQSASPQFRIRGSEPHQNRILIEGIPLTDPVYLSDQLGIIPSSASTFWELYPAGPPAFFMEGGTGGAINIRLFQSVENPRLSFQTGSFGFTRLSGQIPKVLGSNLAMEYLQSQENFPYQQTGQVTQERENNAFYRASMMPQWLLWKRDRLQGELFSINSFQKTQIPGPVSRPMNKSLENFFHLTGFRLKTALGEKLQLDNSAYARVQKEWLKDLAPAQTEESQYLSGGLQTKVVWGDRKKEVRAGLGANITDYGWKEKLRSDTQRTYRQVSIPFFVDSKLKFDELSLEIQPELMGSFETLSGKKLEKNYFEFSPRLSLSNGNWMFGLGYYFRNPSLSELMGGAQRALANPNLKTEKSLKTDLTWVHSGTRLTVFAAKNDNLIQGLIVDESSFQSQNIGKATFMGVEAGYQNQLGRFFLVSTGASILHAVDRTSESAENAKVLPMRFPFKGFVQLNYQTRSWVSGVRSSVFGPSYLDKENTKKISSYFLFDLFSELNLANYGKCFFEVENLLDLTVVKADFGMENAEVQLSGMNDYPAAGRRIYLKWAINL